MAINLFLHNSYAYLSALSLLETVGKAAVIHPTGTGKSFIGFKLAEDHPNNKILWLTPSEYIVKTQLENLVKEGGAELGNITFITYVYKNRENDNRRLGSYDVYLYAWRNGKCCSQMRAIREYESASQKVRLKI